MTFPPLNLLRSFLAVVQTGSTVRAARLLSLSQAAISKHMVMLEEIIGEPLFERSTQGLDPNEAGRALYRQVAAPMDRLSMAMQRLLKAASESEDMVRLGAPLEYFQERLELPLISCDRRFSMQFGSSTALLRRLTDDELDLAITTFRPQEPELIATPLCSETFHLVGARDFDLPPIEDPGAMEAWLATQPWISYAPTLPMIGEYWRQVFGCNPVFQPSMVIPNLQSIATSVAAGRGLSVLPDYVCVRPLEHGELTVVWRSPVPVRNTLWLVNRAINHLEPSLRAMRELLTVGTQHAGRSAEPPSRLPLTARTLAS